MVFELSRYFIHNNDDVKFQTEVKKMTVSQRRTAVGHISLDGILYYNRSLECEFIFIIITLKRKTR